MKGQHPDQNDEEPSDEKYYALYEGDPPRIEHYNHYYTEDEATWFQLYETVSEGTPVSPPFETKEELSQYLHENGDFWTQMDLKKPEHLRRRGKPTLEQARSLVETGFALSGMIRVDDNGNAISGFLDAYQQQDTK